MTPHANRLTGKSLYGRPMAFTDSNEGPYGTPYLNNGETPYPAFHRADWHIFVRSSTCFFKRLCMYCGNRMTGPVVFAKTRYRTSDRYNSSGPGGHPTCILYATRSCPHITQDPTAGVDDDIVAYVVMCEVGIDPDLDKHGEADPEATFKEGFNSVVSHAVPITMPELKELAREYPER